MKKLSLLFLLITSSIFAQNNPFKVYVLCYTNGDTIPTEVLEKQYTNFELGLLKYGQGQTEAWITSFEVAVYHGSKIKIIPAQKQSTTLFGIMGSMNKIDTAMPEKIVIQEITINIKTGDKITSRKLPPHTFYRAKTTSKKC